MPLSEYEQRVLAQMENQLREADPQLAKSLDNRARLDLTKLSVGVAIGLVGLGVLVAGVAISQIWLGILGFLAMLGGALYAISGSASPRKSGKGSGGPANPPAPKSSSFMNRQQERWERWERGER